MIRRVLLRGLLACAVAHLILQSIVGLPILWRRTDTGRDVPVYWLAARAVRERQPLYWPKPGFGPRVPWGRWPMEAWYLYPPHFAALISPLAALPYVTFARLWYIPLLIAFWVYAGCLARLATGRVTWQGTLIAGMALTLTPGAALALVYGNVDVILYALFGLALVTPWTGKTLAAIAVIKPYAVFALALASLREGRRIWLPALAVIVAALSLGVAVCGAQSYLDWVRHALSAVGQGTFYPNNVSLSFLPLRLALWMGWDCPYGPLPAPFRQYLTATALAAPLAAAWLTRRAMPSMQYACVTVVAVLFSPYCLTSYLPLLLAPAAIWAGSRYPGLSDRLLSPGLNPEFCPPVTETL